MRPRLPGKLLRGHGQRGVKCTADPECAGRHHRAADPGFHRCQSEAEAKEEEQVLKYLSGVPFP